ncbi:MAG: hypothetical protein L6R43_01500 [Planctomycetes bacterium]|nr:hypothetical protein [Planctomycetota bacterium]
MLPDPSRERIERELARLLEGGLNAQLFDGDRPLVLYRGVPAGGQPLGLPDAADVVVPVPPGYPGSPIDLAALPLDSPFLSRVKGGTNSQGTLTLDGRNWQLASYHPHGNGGGPPWDQTRFGFHTYADHLISWLHKLN